MDWHFSAEPLLTRRPPHPAAGKPGYKGLPRQRNQTNPLTLCLRYAPLPHPLPFFLCWLDFSLGHHEILVHVSNRADRLKGQKDCLNDWLTSSLCLDLCFFCLNYRGSWIFIGSEWHPIISCCKIGVNWINLMSWSLIKIPLRWCQGEFSGGCPYLYVVLTCEWWLLHGLPLGNCSHNSSAYQAQKELWLSVVLRYKSDSSKIQVKQRNEWLLLGLSQRNFNVVLSPHTIIYMESLVCRWDKSVFNESPVAAGSNLICRCLSAHTCLN